jgi:hypothetical protein
MRVDAASGERVEHETTEQIVADDAGERGSEPEARRPARGDPAGSPDRELRGVDEVLDLSEDRLDFLAGEDQVRIAVAEHDEIESRLLFRLRWHLWRMTVADVVVIPEYIERSV